MRYSTLVKCLIPAAALLCVACVARQQVVRSSALDFLYPEGAESVPAADVRLQLPVRVGLAFSPYAGREPISEDRRQALLLRIAEAFEEREVIASMEVIPTTYLSPRGGFENLDRLKVAFGVDLIVLLSYEQTQFSETTRKSIAYWTIVGAYVVKGEKNETRTILEAVVYDIPSRALLFRAAGDSSSTGSSTPIDTERMLRLDAEKGFEAAAEDLIVNLEQALEVFEEQAKSGTVRGVGTPEIRLVDASGASLGPEGEGGFGGAFGILDLLLLLALGAAAWAAARARRPSSQGTLHARLKPRT